MISGYRHNNPPPLFKKLQKPRGGFIVEIYEKAQKVQKPRGVLHCGGGFYCGDIH